MAKRKPKPKPSPARRQAAKKPAAPKPRKAVAAPKQGRTPSEELVAALFGDAQPHFVVTVKIGRETRQYAGEETTEAAAKRAARRMYEQRYPDRKVEIVGVRTL